MGEDPEISIIIPVFNEAQVFPRVLKGLEENVASWGNKCEILVIDDGSTDGGNYENSSSIARVIKHPINLGNGAAIKTGIREASGEYIVVLDADGQHSPDEAKVLVESLSDYHLVVGQRNFRSDGTLLRNIANRFYCALASYMSDYQIKDLTSGFRAFRKKEALEIIHLLPNRFSYPTTMTMAMIKMGYSVKYSPINVSSRQGTSKISIMKDGMGFLLIIMKIATLFSPMRIFFPLALALGSFGLINYILVLMFEHRFSLWSLVMFTSSITIFMIGLVAEEISFLNLRRER